MSKRASELLRRQSFLCTLLMIVLIGSFLSQAVMRLTGQLSIRFFVVPVMLLMSLTLDTSQITAIFRQPAGVGLGVLLGYTAVPLLAWLGSHLF